MAFNYTNLTSSNDVTGLFIFSNDATQGAFGPLILFATFMIAFIAMKPYYETPKCFAAAAFITMTFSLAMRVVGVINDYWMYACLILVAVSAVTLIISSNR